MRRMEVPSALGTVRCVSVTEGTVGRVLMVAPAAASMWVRRSWTVLWGGGLGAERRGDMAAWYSGS